MSAQTSRAMVSHDFAYNGVKIAIARDYPAGMRQVLTFGEVAIKTVEEGQDLDARDMLRISTDDARALYEALAEHFGHNGHDVRALRKDYDAERARVDKMLNHLIGARP